MGLMEIGNNLQNRTNRAQLLLKLGLAFFVGGVVAYVAGYLSQEQITPIATMALILAGAGSRKKQMKKK
ncbi:MAG: hypothetical protein IBX40_11735 [Methanosarcinales archaeon]|nr:hypothetical protein [Methanosarcinales archaeon]